MAIIRGQQVSTQLSGSYIISGSTQELIADSITLTGNVTASGVIKADAFESVVGGTTIDFNDDINIEGDVSASSTSTGSFGRAEIFGNIKAKVTSGGHTVDLSSVDGSEINQLSSAQSDGMYNSIHMKNSSGINLLANSVKLQIQNESGTPYYQFSTTQFKARQTNQEIINFSKVSGSSSSTFSGGTSTFTDYGGNVSGSATSTGSFGILQLRGSDSQAVIDFTRATSNTIIGFANTGAGITTGAAGNTLIGYQVGQLITTGDHNVAIGQENLSQGNSTGNTAVGYRALKAVTTAIGNVGIGRNAADALQSGNFNIGIGQGADLGSITAEHRIVIGHDAAATADNQTVIGGSTQTQVVFGGSDTTLSLSGSMEISGSGPATSASLHIRDFSYTDTHILSQSLVVAVDGNNGRLFSVTDQMTGSLFSANTVAGLPVIEAFSDNKVTLGPFSSQVIVDSSGNLSGSATSTGSFGIIENNTQIAGFRPIINQTANFSASLSNAGRYHIVHGNLTCSIGTDVSMPVTIGAEYEFFQSSSVGNFLFQTGSGVSLLSKNDNRNIAGQHSGATLKKVAANTFHLVGDLT